MPADNPRRVGGRGWRKGKGQESEQITTVISDTTVQLAIFPKIIFTPPFLHIEAFLTRVGNRTPNDSHQFLKIVVVNRHGDVLRCRGVQGRLHAGDGDSVGSRAVGAIEVVGMHEEAQHLESVVWWQREGV